MKWIEAKVVFACENESLAVELIADIFSTLGIRGVVVDDPHLEPAEGWGQDAVPRPSKPAVTAYFPADDRLIEHRRRLEQNLSRLARDQGIDASVTYCPVNEENWAESWKAFFWPEEITPGIVVKPTWRDYRPSADQMVIEIDPGMAFGTGTHPTTAMCVRLLHKYVRQDQSVLDVGTGSGILLIAAAKLGATRLTGIDLDPLAVEVARSNLSQNHIDPQSVNLQCADLVDSVSGFHDLVVANILAEVIIELLDDVASILKPGGIFICSGIIEAFQSGIAEKMAFCGFDLLDIEKDSDWVAFAGKLKSRP